MIHLRPSCPHGSIYFLEQNTNFQSSIAGAGVGGNIGKRREKGEEQEEHARRIRSGVE